MVLISNSSTFPYRSDAMFLGSECCRDEPGIIMLSVLIECLGSRDLPRKLVRTSRRWDLNPAPNTSLDRFNSSAFEARLAFRLLG